MRIISYVLGFCFQSQPALNNMRRRSFPEYEIRVESARENRL